MAGSAICSVDECDRTAHGQGLCQKHLRRQRKFGSTEPPVGAWGQPTDERFWRLADRRGDDECWLWQGGRGGSKKFEYGIFRLAAGGKTYGAHRFAYALTNGEIPDGMEIDHTCHQPLCVNPRHLRLTTKKQNKENRQGAHGRSGIRGAYQTRNGRWRAIVVHNRKSIHVGCFGTAEEAGEAARLKRLELFTHSDADVKVV